MAENQQPGHHDTPPGEPLASREPRPFLMHWAVATAVVFLATVILAWFILGVPLFIVIIGSALIGLAAAPYTRRNEERSLLERQENLAAPPDDDSAAGGAPDGGIS